MTDAGFRGKWPTQLRKGVLELATMNVLAKRRMYGYDIVRVLRSADALVVSEGTIYPLLIRLKGEGLVESVIEESSEGPPRKYYSLSIEGRRQLRWMNEHWEQLRTGVEHLISGDFE